MEDSGIGRSLSQALGSIVDALPALIGALLILIIGYIIAKVLQGVVTRVLQSMGFQGWMERGGIKQFFDRSQTRQTPLSILGKLVFWLVFFIAISMAVDTLGITAISEVLAQFIAYIPQIIAAALILILATLLANFVAGIVRGATGSNVAGSNVAGSIAQYGIIVFAAFAALTQLGIAEELIVPTFLILLGAVALAAALAFGLGGQGVAQRLVEQGYQKSGEARQQIQQNQQQNQQQQVSSSESSYTRVDSGDTRRLR
ncbi:MAG: mechanosensitive ion channel [Actinomycetota bacterium]|nr:mechanosensitive ion channel [Actinomycetota bacterium]